MGAQLEIAFSCISMVSAKQDFQSDAPSRLAAQLSKPDKSKFALVDYFALLTLTGCRGPPNNVLDSPRHLPDVEFGRLQ